MTEREFWPNREEYCTGYFQRRQISMANATVDPRQEGAGRFWSQGQILWMPLLRTGRYLPFVSGDSLLREWGQQEPDGPDAAGRLDCVEDTLQHCWHHREAGHCHRGFSYLYEGNPVGSLFQDHPRSCQTQTLHFSFPNIIVQKHLHSLLLYEDALKFWGNLNRIERVEARKLCQNVGNFKNSYWLPS